jgi:type II secretory pathway pseudopilin PulG
MPRKNFFTLLELMLVVALLSISLGLVGFLVPKAIKKETFASSVEKLSSKISFAQEMMMDLSTDVFLNLNQEEGKVTVFFKSHGLNASREKQCNRDPALNGILKIEWQGEEANNITLSFLHSTQECPLGILVLHGPERREIYLSGYPRNMEKNEKLFQAHQAPYPETARTPP